MEHTRIHFMRLMKMYGSSKAVEGTTFILILSDDGKWERTGSGFVFKNCDHLE